LPGQQEEEEEEEEERKDGSPTVLFLLAETLHANFVNKSKLVTNYGAEIFATCANRNKHLTSVNSPLHLSAFSGILKNKARACAVHNKLPNRTGI